MADKRIKRERVKYNNLNVLRTEKKLFRDSRQKLLLLHDAILRKIYT